MISNTISNFKYNIMGASLLIFSIMEFSIAGYMFINKEQTIDKNKEEKEIIQSCLNYAQKITERDSFIINQMREENKLVNKISFKKYGLENPVKDIYSTSLIIKECSKLELVEYCYGEECKTPNGLSMILELK